MDSGTLRITALTLLGVAGALLGYGLFAVDALSAPDRGRRGVERAAVLAKGGSFSALEPLMRLVAGHISELRLKGLREQQAFRLRRAGYYLGLGPDEYSALVVLSGVLFCAVGAGLASVLDRSILLYGAAGVLLGALLPISQVEGAYKRRAKNITRGLPSSIYIAAMCMGAGLDFPGALRLITRGQDLETDDVAKEFTLILEELEVGHTRKQALEAFAERVPIPAVVDFVRAVIQSEDKGSPLSQTLLIQAKMLNLKRTVAAEEAAARAAVLMIGPLMLLMGCILIILMGPFIVTGGGM